MSFEGITVEELIDILNTLKKEYGPSVKVFAGGEDYPGGVEGVSYIPLDRGNAYVPGNCLVINIR